MGVQTPPVVPGGVAHRFHGRGVCAASSGRMHACSPFVIALRQISTWTTIVSTCPSVRLSHASCALRGGRGRGGQRRAGRAAGHRRRHRSDQFRMLATHDEHLVQTTTHSRPALLVLVAWTRSATRSPSSSMLLVERTGQVHARPRQ